MRHESYSTTLPVLFLFLPQFTERIRKYEAAEPLYLQAIEIFTQSLGEEHPNTQTVLINYLIFLNEKNESKQSKDKY